jgi:hypothetical protein
MDKLKLKVTVDKLLGAVSVLDERAEPTSQEEFLQRSYEHDVVIAEIYADDAITEKEIEFD